MLARLRLGHRIAPPRFLLFALATLVTAPAAIAWLDWRRGAMLGFDVGALLFLFSCVSLLRETDTATIRSQARANDANRTELLGITSLVTLVILVAVAAEISQQGSPKPIAVILIVATLALAWMFGNLVYALHYAHLYYAQEQSGGDAPGQSGGDARGLDFPGDADPDYSDFLYFSATLGMTFQTSDVEICDRRMRRVVSLHAFAAFVFNIGVLSFTVNVLGG